ncbi:hypothetical protein GCM10010913_21040 [Paenibacillus aceti]|uniref:Uncharacterized protein n=1 Tax=Paenibacillus aceti TaxID=1820010 RepID=A0ABQ1VU11_9BACL|nr:hypothetical protein GCM10010913_21040 [Paenibacillus aceti]
MKSLHFCRFGGWLRFSGGLQGYDTKLRIQSSGTKLWRGNDSPYVATNSITDSIRGTNLVTNCLGGKATAIA